jgi:redox-sensitive bicupin YhaK (pirin superfamily)
MPRLAVQPAGPPQAQDERAPRRALAEGLQPGDTPPLLLTESWLSAGAFDYPPPRGMQSVTLLLSGRLRPGRRSSPRPVLHAGDLRWASWRSDEIGVAEGSASGTTRLVRLWCASLNTAACPEPFFHDTPTPHVASHDIAGGKVRVLCGSCGGVPAAAATPPALTFLELDLAPGTCFVHALSSADCGVVYALEGTGSVGRASTLVSQGKPYGFSATPAETCRELKIMAGRSGLHALVAAAPGKLRP